MPLLDYEPKFRVSNVAETQFFTSTDSKNKDFALEDLARSGLEPQDLGAKFPAMLKLPEKALAGYVIPYYGLDGQPLTDSKGDLIMFRTRLRYPEFAKESRYLQPSGEQLGKYGLPTVLPYIHPLTLTLEADTLVCAEGEKKAVSIIKFLNLPAFGIGGYQMWRAPDGSGGVHPWIRELLRKRNLNSVTIVPDGDVFRYDICQGYGTFARALEADGVTVKILNPRGKIDDLLVSWRGDAADNFKKLESIDPKDLVQSPASLIKRFGVAFKVDSKDRPVVYQHTANIMRVMEEHNAFPRIWRNLDNNRVMVGDAPATPDLTEMQIANYFQYNLGFDKVGHKTIYACIQSLAKQNSSSPMLDYVRAQIWDNVRRLDSWLTKFWGVEDTSFAREIAAKWLISSCARLEKPGTKIDWMFIAVGPQGTGKTSMPSILFKGNSLTLYGEHNDKDLHLLLHSALCVGFDELDSFGKRESSNLKAMITRNEDSFRPPYGASVEIFPRRFVLYGCGNRYEFLQHDPSGYRRYAILEVTRLLDFRGLEAERDQLWAEAWHRYTMGEQYWEIAGTSEQAEKFVTPNPMEDQIIGWIEAQKMNKSGTNVKDGWLYFTMNQLLTGIGMEREASNPHKTREMAAIVRGLKAESQNSRKSPVPGVSGGRFYRINIAGS